MSERTSWTQEQLPCKVLKENGLGADPKSSWEGFGEGTCNFFTIAVFYLLGVLRL